MGCCTCLGTSCLCTLCWPLSPALGSYMCCQRSMLHNIYGVDSITSKKWCGVTFNNLKAFAWPSALMQHNEFLMNKKKDNLLHYKWATEALTTKDSKQQIPKRKDKLIMIVGSESCGKTETLMKLSGSRIPSSSHDMQVGLKPVHVSAERITFLEFWDVPERYLPATGHLIRHVSCIMLLFDATEELSFLVMKRIYSAVTLAVVEDHHRESAPPKYICVGTKSDLLVTANHQGEGGGGGGGGSDYDDDDDGDRKANDVTRASDVLQLGQNWAKEQGFPFVVISSSYNYGVLELYRTVLDLVQC